MADIKIKRTNTAGDYAAETTVEITGADYINEELIKSILMSPDRLRQLVQAEKDGRCMMLPNGHYGGKDGEEALKHVMHVVGITNNAINRYIADAVAEKLVREEAEKALEENRCGE